ncbi:unnamed protein product [Rotaria magnacalcarata]|uniref:Serine hydrolase domain-containing protein n=2 Tax=Rotaria magnacalcarata TaxID=392030 RepID=A0A816T6I4_9BILA|nr:unnamed protein product [Rotaria magnacalcarata]
MLLNKVLFPAPKPPHYTLTSHSENLFWLPPESTNQLSIPCMFYSPDNLQRQIEYFMIFCHGNGCDIGTMQYTLSEFSKHLNVYIISFEYPSYGLCEASSPNQQTINNHADRTINFVCNTLQWPIERIIVYGHSIGSGSACYLASNKPIGALILQSPYTAINNLVKEKIGLLSLFVSGRSWNNLEAMKDIKCPILFIHGSNDTLIPPSHSQILYNACSHIDAKRIIILRYEDHNSMSEITLLKYVKPFVEKQCTVTNTNIHLPIVKIDEELRQLSESLPNNNRTTTTTTSSNSDSGVLNSLYAIARASTTATISSIQKASGKRDESSNENQ